MTTLYGISNCDTVKKARRWLETQGVAYTYHDFRSDGLSQALLQEWVAAVGWEALLNKRSRTWKELSETERTVVDEKSAVRLMLAHPTLIKRPVIVINGKVYNGFNESEYKLLFSQTASSAAQGL